VFCGVLRFSGIPDKMQFRTRPDIFNKFNDIRNILQDLISKPIDSYSVLVASENNSSCACWESTKDFPLNHLDCLLWLSSVYCGIYRCIVSCKLKLSCDSVFMLQCNIIITTVLCRSYGSWQFRVTFNWVTFVFAARYFASAVLAMALCPSVCLSITSRCSTKTAKRRITQTPHDSPGTLVSWRQRSPRNSTGVTPYEGAECGWGGSKSATFDQ